MGIEVIDLRVFPAAFFAILFLQSGVDKVIDRQGNLAWMQPHFESSPFKGKVPLFLSVLTLLELGTGACNAAAIVLILIKNSFPLPGIGLLAAGATLLALFAGQRLAKDYAGAASLASYFSVLLIGLLIAGK